MTPRVEIDWIDADDPHEEILRTIRECQHEQLLVGRRGSIDEPLGMILKKDLLDQVLDGKSLDPMAVVREPLIVHDATPIFRVLEQFKRAPVRLAIVVDEYGSLVGIVTQTDLLEAIAGDLPDVEGEEPDIVVREDGSLLIDGMMPAHDAFARLGFRSRSAEGDFHTIAGFALAQLGHLPEVGEHFRLRGVAVRDRRYGRETDRQAACAAGVGGRTNGFAISFEERNASAARAETVPHTVQCRRCPDPVTIWVFRLPLVQWVIGGLRNTTIVMSTTSIIGIITKGRLRSLIRTGIAIIIGSAMPTTTIQTCIIGTAIRLSRSRARSRFFSGIGR